MDKTVNRVLTPADGYFNCSTVGTTTTTKTTSTTSGTNEFERKPDAASRYAKLQDDIDADETRLNHHLIAIYAICTLLVVVGVVVALSVTTKPFGASLQNLL